MTRVLLVPDLPIEHWPAMDRYASRLVHHMEGLSGECEIAVAAKIGRLTVDQPKSGHGDRPLSPRPLPQELRLSPSQLRLYLTRYWLYPRRVERMQADVVHVLDHCYGHILLGKSRRPSIVTVHDLIPMMMAQRSVSGLGSRLRARMLVRSLTGVRLADAWIVATDWLRSELAEWLGHDERIRVIPYGVDDDFFLEPDQDPQIMRETLGIPPDAFVVLHVGSVGARKNVSTVVAAVHGLRERGVDAWLLQVGDGLTAEQRSDLEARKIDRYAAVMGPTSEKDLRLAYRAADVLLFPSHYEGVGLPVLEAMASGLPAVTSGAGGLKEVAGDAAVVVSGREAEPYVVEILRLAEDAAWRDDLVGRGREHASRYRWVDAARKTLEAYNDIA
ncbi:MAG: glycosyltransferase family 4 protein [Gemmatimonadota bacterium]|nr:MAG: glycosyltransferase family 4 protein [Gemmatimonadota bacterium]